VAWFFSKGQVKVNVFRRKHILPVLGRWAAEGQGQHWFMHSGHITKITCDVKILISRSCQVAVCWENFCTNWYRIEGSV